MNFNLDPIVSCNDLLLYKGEMKLIPHQGDSYSGEGMIELACGGAKRHLLIQFKKMDEKKFANLPASADGKYGRGTSFMKMPYSENFFVFVTNSTRHGEVIGESDSIGSDTKQECEKFELYLLNSLLPDFDLKWTLGECNIVSVRTDCAYSLSRVLLPNYEINLTHKLTVTRNNHQSFQWELVETDIRRLLTFLGFANCTYVSAPVIYGFVREEIRFFQFSTPKRVVPLNRRSWATNISEDELQNALTCFLDTTENPFWNNILNRAIEWQILAEAAIPDSLEQALSTTQMLLEMLSFVLLVEDSAILSEDGYSRLPAADRINLLCSHINHQVPLQPSRLEEVRSFCASNSVNSVGELITSIRNKLIHPTRKNREYLDRVPISVRSTAVWSGIQIASLAILKVIGYKGHYYDIITHQRKMVPWI